MTPHEKARIHVRSLCAFRTITKYPNVSEASAIRIREAARVEGIVLPGDEVKAPPNADK